MIGRRHRNGPRRRGPAQVILFEGWCVGARPQADDALGTPVNALEESRDPNGVWRRFVNQRLGGPYQDLFREISLQIMFRPPSFDIILKMAAGTGTQAA